MSANIGWLFYRDYYEGTLNLMNDENAQARHFLAKNDTLFAQRLPDPTILNTLKLPLCNASFPLTITGAGLLIGTRYTHETGMMGEVKIGFYFDHTTGVPLLPGSSVKGILRSVFPSRFKPDYQKSRVTFLQHLLNTIGVANAEQFDLARLTELEAEFFDNLRNGEPAPPDQRDVFGDAYPSVPTNGQFLASEFITPHKGPTKNPVPLNLLRIRPGVTMTFQFRLTNGILTIRQKEELCKLILLSEGIGAKTNVGFGRLKRPNTQVVEPGGYQPAANLSPLPVAPPKVASSSASASVLLATDTTSPQPELVIITDPRPTIFNSAKHQLKNGHYYLIGKAKKGDFVEAVAVKKSLMNSKQTHFKVFIGDQEVEKHATYNFDARLVGKPFLMRVQSVSGKDVVVDVAVERELTLPAT